MAEGTKPAVTPAREGRELQRYGDDGQRLTAGCVVLREGSGKSRECLMITSTKDPSRWVFPKGGWELDETLEEAAQRETLEVPATSFPSSRAPQACPKPRHAEHFPLYVS
jgi:hypothetical protein